MIFNADHSCVLLIKRRDVPVWVLPGGGVEQGEECAEAVLREVFEESALQVEICRKVAEYTPINSLALLTHLFECRVIAGVPSTGAETLDIAFFPIDKAREQLFVIHRCWLDDALRNDEGVIKAALSNVTYRALAIYFFRHPLHTLRFLLSRCGVPINNALPPRQADLEGN